MEHEIKKQIERYYHYWFGVNALYEKWAKEHHLTANSLFSLYIIHENPDFCTSKMICDLLFLPKQTVNTLLDGFIAKGYIEKKVCVEDKRNKRILFTEKGQKYADDIVLELFEFEAHAMQSMDNAQREGLIENSHLFLSRLKQALDNPQL